MFTNKNNKLQTLQDVVATTTYDAYTPKVAQAQRYVSFRKGVWVDVEMQYFQLLVQLFSDGLLDILHNYPLRIFLAHSMACDPMRISKKFVGSNQIGKQRYVRKSNYDDQDTLRKISHTFQTVQGAFRALLIEKKKDLEIDIRSRVLWPKVISGNLAKKKNKIF